MESRQRLDINQLQYNFCYYTSEGSFRLNVKTFLMLGLVLDSCLVILSADQLFKDGNYIGLIFTSILFMVILITIRRLNRNE
jgi:hypothetical protein